MKDKIYYTLSNGSNPRRIFIKASSKSAAAQTSGISADMWALCKDSALIAAAQNVAQIEIKPGIFEVYTK
jgi:hypothetical protein